LQEEGENEKNSRIQETIPKELNRKVNPPPSPIYFMRRKRYGFEFQAELKFGYKYRKIKLEFEFLLIEITLIEIQVQVGFLCITELLLAQKIDWRCLQEYKLGLGSKFGLEPKHKFCFKFFECIAELLLTKLGLGSKFGLEPKHKFCF
jgi:hypothetical protein